VGSDHTDLSSVGQGDTVAQMPADEGSNCVEVCEDMAPNCHIGVLGAGRLGPKLIHLWHWQVIW